MCHNIQRIILVNDYFGIYVNLLFTTNGKIINLFEKKNEFSHNIRINNNNNNNNNQNILNYLWVIIACKIYSISYIVLILLDANVFLILENE